MHAEELPWALRESFDRPPYEIPKEAVDQVRGRIHVSACYVDPQDHPTTVRVCMRLHVRGATWESVSRFIDVGTPVDWPVQLAEMECSLKEGVWHSLAGVKRCYR
jgi:hypothetical protein